MPRLLHHNGSGRPGTAPFPADWQATHAPVMQATMTATIAFTRAGQPTFGDGFDVTIKSTDVWSGQVRIQARDLQGQRGTGETGEDTNPRDYLVQVPYAVDVLQVGDEGLVLSSPDPSLVGRSLRIGTVLHGDLRFTRDVIATLDTQEPGR